MSQDITKTVVPFHGDEIICAETPNGVFVAVKPICERLCIASNKQVARLKRDERRWRGNLMVLPSAGGMQETYCIPVTKPFGWLATITVSRVKPESRDALIAYQNEADAVLDRHFRLREAQKDARIAEMERMLWHSSQHLRMARPKWQKAYALKEMGKSDYAIAHFCNWTMPQCQEQLEAMRDCGINPKWREDMASLSERLWSANHDLKRFKAGQKDLFDA